jgi:hypothetical protein
MVPEKTANVEPVCSNEDEAVKSDDVAAPFERIVMRDAVAKEVFLALEEDGYYGPYTLGKELWDRFRAAYTDA